MLKPYRPIFLLLLALTAVTHSTRLVAADPLGSLNQALNGLGLDDFQQELLPADEAFRFISTVKDGRTIRLDWQIAEGYYLYREKFAASLAAEDNVKTAEFQLPHGKAKYDEVFGDVEVFYRQVGFDLPLLRENTAGQQITITAKYQGCADLGVCYPPIKKTVTLMLPPLQTVAQSAPSIATGALSESGQIAVDLEQKPFGLTVLTFLGLGVLLAFTPCIFPMIPILSGIIAGQGNEITATKGFLLSLSYVLAMALCYAVFGIVAGLFGSNLQALFQEPWIIVTFSAVFIALAFSMFGFYKLQMPTAIQSRIATISRSQQGGTYISVAIMGALSTLIVGPCVAAPLAGALIYIGNSGDAILGFSALFALGLGMGAPLLLLGASAGRLLPKVGTWMNAVQATFGVGLLAVAVWLLERILPASVTMILWALLLILPAIYLNAIDALPANASGWRKLWKGAGVVMLSYGVLLLIGVASGSSNPLQPLKAITAGIANTQSAQPVFLPQTVTTVSELNESLRVASSNSQWVMLDFYADWCISCKELEYYTFSDPAVQAALKDVVLIQADVTENNSDSVALLKKYALIGPPAVLFFGPDQQERRAFRIIGYQGAESFIVHLKRLFA